MSPILIASILSVTQVTSTLAGAAIEDEIRALQKGRPYAALHYVMTHPIEVSDQPRVVAAVGDAIDRGSDQLTEEAAIALQQFARKRFDGMAAVVPVLVRALDHAKPVARCRLIGALGAIGPDSHAAVPALRDILAEDQSDYFEGFYQCRAATALVQIIPGDEEAIDFLSERLGDETDYVRWMAAEGLMLSGERAKKAVPVLREHLEDRHPTVRVMSARALWRMQHDVDVVLPAYVRALDEEEASYYTEPSKSALNDNGMSQRVEALLGLTELDDAAAPATPTLIRLLDDKDPFIRVRAARALGSIGPPAQDAIPFLQRWIMRADGDMYQAARESLQSIRGD